MSEPTESREIAAPVWVVTSPTYRYTEIVCMEGGPTYDIADEVLVEAPNRAAAKWALLRWARRMHSDWAMPGYYHNGHPLRGVRVRPATKHDTPKAWGSLFLKAETPS